MSGFLNEPQSDPVLTEEDRQFIEKAFSNWMEVPLEFRTALRNWLAQDELFTLGTTQIYGLDRLISGAAASIPTGGILPFAGTSAPSGYLLCHGQAVSRSTYKNLHDAIHETYGAGDGSTTFNVPDLQGRLPVGVGSHGDVNSLGKNDGAALANRRMKHKHTVNETAHFHTTGLPTQALVAGSSTAMRQDVNVGGTANFNSDSKTTGLTVGPQSGAEPLDTPSFLVIEFLIAT